MNGKSLSGKILGIKLKSDGFSSTFDDQNDAVIIGSIICEDLSLNCEVFRKRLFLEVQCLPNNFKFLCKNGWPIDKRFESKISISQLVLSNVITIQRHFDLPRLGVKWSGGEYLGFIFCSFNSSLSTVREIIDDELNNKLIDLDTKFEFVEKNGWPVTLSQENYLTVWDIHDGNICKINKLTNKKRAIGQDPKIKKKSLKLSEKSAFNGILPDQNHSSTSILISYVHAEALIHARDLKGELLNMGIDSVFLDVDDIAAGRDWQDVINTALNKCTAFVALVTPRYGETKWTNREAKLADDKEKLIIPISFLDKWPPDQLAIQFLSLQYIPWITREDFIVDADFLAANDITHWDQRCVHRVAKEIKKLCTQQEVSTPDSSSLLDSRHLLSSDFVSFASAPSQHSNEKKHLILISAHCGQTSFVNKLVNMLGKDYHVCSSIDLAADEKDAYSCYEDSQLSECSPCMDSYSHIKNSPLNSNSSETDFSIKSDYKTSSNCVWKDSPEEGNVQCKKSKFKTMVKNASLVILVISEEYNNSRACKQQAFYCEQRVEVIVIKYGSFQIDNILLNLYPEQDMLELPSDHEDCYSSNFIKNLKKEITKSLESSKHRNTYKDQIQNKVASLKQEIATEQCVYVIGGTNCVSKNAETFCINLGSELARVRNLTLVTEGFFGAGEIVGKNFCEEKEIVAKGKPQCIYHVVPHKDSCTSKRARQKEDGTFEKIPYGQTLFYGDSIAERDDIVSSTFKICVLIEGGERSASLAEKFLWNDCTVVPIIFNNRSISNKVCLAASISKPPWGVNFQDWSKLNKYNSIEELAKIVKKIISDLLKARNKSF